MYMYTILLLEHLFTKITIIDNTILYIYTLYCVDLFNVY